MPKNVAEGLGPRIRNLRRERGLSQRALAAACDMTASSISQIETGRTNPSGGSIWAIASALNTPVAELFLSPLETSDSDASNKIQINSLLASGLERTFAELDSASSTASEQFQRPSPMSVAVVRRHSRRRITVEGHGADITLSLLTSSPEASRDFLIMEFEPGARNNPRPHGHSGREYMYILEGELTLSLGVEETVLMSGDSAAFASTISHRYENTGSVPARALWFVLGAIAG